MAELESRRRGWRALWGRIPRGEALRYLLVGGFNTAFGYGLFALLTFLLTGRLAYAYLWAAALANVIAVSVAFLLYKYFVFRSSGAFWGEYRRTVLVYGGSMLFGIGALQLLVVLGHALFGPRAFVPYLAQLFVLPLGVLLSFVGHRSYSFRRDAPLGD